MTESRGPRSRVGRWFWLLSICVFCGPASAYAQTQGFRLSRGAPGPGVGDGLTGLAPASLRSMEWSAQLWLEYARGPLRAVDVDERQVELVRDQLRTRLSATFGVTERLRILADIPVTLLQTGDPTRFVPPRALGLGDATLGVAWFVWGQAERGPQVGVSLAAVLPTGSTRALAGDGGVGGQAEVQLAYQTTRLRAVAGFGGAYRPTRRYGDLRVGTEITARVAIAAPASDRVSILAELLAVTPAHDLLASGENGVDVLGGARIRVTGPLFATFGMGAGITQAAGTPALRGFFAIGWDNQRSRTGESSSLAVPPSPSELAGLDSDRDGVPDHGDACVDAPEDLDGYADDDGCPDGDNDGDGIADEHDECPDEPESFNGIDDADGCPDWEPQGIQTGPLAQVEPVMVSTRGDLERAGRASLQQVVQLLEDNPQIKKLTIEGHAHHVARQPERSSERAARQVLRMLTRQGIDAGRLHAVGLGDDSDAAGDRTLRGIWVGFHVSEIDETQDAAK